MKALLVLGLCLLLVCAVVVIVDKPVSKEEKLYQGPVRPTDDLDYFRKTGITKPLEVRE